MSRLHPIFLAFGLVGLAAVIASPAQAQVRVRAPGMAGFAHSPAECTAAIPMPLRRNACFACVNRGGRYHLTSNSCHAGAPPPPPPSVAIARSVPDCNTIAFGPKRNRCVSCVTGGGSFMVHMNGGIGHCNAAPPPPPPPVDRSVQRSVGECYSEIRNPEKRMRCRTCVQNGGAFYKHLGNGFGQCTMPTPPADQSVLRSTSDCAAYTHGGKRVRCMNCVQGGGTFFKHAAGGIGQCTMPAPPPSPVMLRSAGECSSYVPNHHMRRNCFRCVASGMTYRNDNGACVGAPPPPAGGWVHSIAGCNVRVPHGGMRIQCRKCVQRGGRWDLGGGGCRY